MPEYTSRIDLPVALDDIRKLAIAGHMAGDYLEESDEKDAIRMVFRAIEVRLDEAVRIAKTP